ncbi:MAG: hypothetical protein CVV64_15360 [Candidatus Wallbacteria bacterium HGW-Wallbacteria-1]|jgi:hypothetical protein|uniref:Uncharacterized protein n=1 Tax=Candidatus Wallbacteria bacterium HGW-Wallbacteria-1 TaxID=2013854 RepID=A0A2N1PLH9_9BACT|nr:MAG: hypothetical protein CVV64_15360 [Candidatus Wallbacteria bacterium HGW-Wallbacteria-1]
MDCYNCGQENPSGTQKCNHCSAPLRDFSRRKQPVKNDTLLPGTHDSITSGGDQLFTSRSLQNEERLGFWFLLTGSLFGVAGFLCSTLPGAMVPQPFSGMLSLGCWAAALYCLYKWGQELSRNFPAGDDEEEL